VYNRPSQIGVAAVKDKLAHQSSKPVAGTAGVTKHKSSHHHQERGSGFDEDAIGGIPPEIAAAMDPQELAL
jgi:hypothetical protein